MKAKILLSIKI